ncbi:NAC domain containing protein 41 [Striga asiatica]|uniref:NAC domain containing protein 41 n=1 Tax=Striga asiatica TaxID=4170 RepID=A0A5A7QJB9_STRAF|nr:NAC domain containing protein 41 [Striga asiatica]
MAASMGIRFHPTDEECMSFLLHAVTGDPLPGISSTADLFGEKEPWEFFSGEENIQERYFYTRLKRVSKKKNNNSKVGSYHRYCRNIGKGTWSNKGRKVPIHGDRGSLLGQKRTFRYESRKGNYSVGEWTLKEYSLPDSKLGQVKPEFKDYVLCLVRRKKDKNKRRDSEAAAEADLPYLLSTLVNRPHVQGGMSRDEIYCDDYNSGVSTLGDQSSHTRQLGGYFGDSSTLGQASNDWMKSDVGVICVDEEEECAVQEPIKFDDDDAGFGALTSFDVVDDSYDEESKLFRNLDNWLRHCAAV